jgi:hypothetical protein
MTKNLIALMCALILTGFGAAATAEPASSSQPAQPSQALAPVPVAPLLLEPALSMDQGACSQSLLGGLVPAPILMASCAGGEGGPCDKNLDCRGYFCPLGSIRYCWGGTGSGCLGTCGCN